MRYHVELVVPGLTVCGKERITRTMGGPLGMSPLDGGRGWSPENKPYSDVDLS